MNALQSSQPASDSAAPGYTAYAQLIKMLLPSSGCLAVYDVGGDLNWCSGGYERPDFRELVDAFRSRSGSVEPNLGQLSQTSAGASALVAKLVSESGQALAYVLIELGPAHSGAGNTMAASLTRPLLGCLATQLALESSLSSRAPAPTPGPVPAPAAPAQQSESRLRQLLNVCSVGSAGPARIHELLERCVDQLDCMSAVFCVPDQQLTEMAFRDTDQDEQVRSQFETTMKPLIAWAQLNNRPMVVNGIDKANTQLKILSCPVMGRDGRTSGLLALFRTASGANFELDDVALIEILSRQAMALVGQYRDSLTGLLSGSALEDYLDLVLGSGERVSAGALLYFDIAEFNLKNSATGFDAGDDLLRQTAQLIRQSLKPGETAGRLFGDRFVVHMPDADAEIATERGAELVATASQLDCKLKLGVATRSANPVCGRHWIAAAEQACRESYNADS